MNLKVGKILKTRNHYDLLDHYYQESRRTKVVNWWIGNECNYRCSYCPECYHNGSKEWADYEIAKKFCGNILEKFQGDKVLFEFTGGEITLWKHFVNLATFLKENHAYIGIISNGSRNVKWWHEHINLFDIVNLSYHSEFVDEDHFLAVLNEIRNKLRVHVNIMMLPKNFTACIKFARKVVEMGNMSVALQPLLVNMRNEIYGYSKAQLRIINNQEKLVSKVKWTKEFPIFRCPMNKFNSAKQKGEMVSPHTLVANNENTWKGWQCYAGVEQIVIDPNGDIYRGRCEEGGKIGNIYEQSISLPTEPIICSKDRCTCNFDIACTKKITS